MTTLAGDLSIVEGEANGVGTFAQFYGPQSICFGSTSQVLYVSEDDNNLIRSIDMSSGEAVVTTLAGGDGGTSSGSNNGVGTFATFSSPDGLAFDSTLKVLFVSDNGNNLIRSIDMSSGESVVSTLAGGAGGTSSGSNNGIGTYVSFNYPIGLSFGSTTQVLFVAAFYNSCVRSIELGQVTTSQLCRVKRFLVLWYHIIFCAAKHGCSFGILLPIIPAFTRTDH